MDKRKKKTSVYQYTIYLKMLEDDKMFRSGTFPDNDVGYIARKWKELGVQLNQCSIGPQLEPEDWKKRLMDWKHTTRSKHRKSLTKTISGRGTIQMTALEKKGISLWGTSSEQKKIVNKNVSIDDSSTIEKIDVEIELDEKLYSNEIDPPPQLFKIIDQKIIVPETQIQDETEINVEVDNEKNNEEETFLDISIEKESEKQQPLIISPDVSAIDVQNIGNQLQRLADIKQEKLKFEIEKFKFKNPGFRYDL